MKYFTAVFNRKSAYTIITTLIIIAGSWLAIRYARGDFRIGSQQQILTGTGLLSANSLPTAAQVFINDKLVTATDDTVYLEPDRYTIELKKEGYRNWKKELIIEQELVTQTNARLFPVAPSLSTLTFTGVQNISPSPDGKKILYYTDSASSERKNGLYILNLSDSRFTLQDGPWQLAEDSEAFDLANAQFIWSPDSSEILLLNDDREVLLQANQKNALDTIASVSFQKKQLLLEWEQEIALREQQFLKEFPPEILAVATQSATNVYLSPDKKKLVYTATESAVLAEGIVENALPTPDLQQENRTLEPNAVYVYDREEDRNYLIIQNDAISEAQKILLTSVSPDSSTDTEAQQLATDSAQLTASTSAETAQNFRMYHTPLYSNALQWFPDSNHLLYTNEQTIKVISFDGTNDTVLYSGPFEDDFVYPWPDGNRLLIKTALSPETPVNLYAIEIK